MQQATSLPKCFVLMPFSECGGITEKEWTCFFENILKPIVEDLGYQCTRASVPRGNIVKHIMQDIQQASVVIADLTGENSNVFYEVATRHALRVGTIMITRDSPEDLPFDLRNYNVVQYSVSAEGKAQFRHEIENAIRDVEAHPDRLDSPAFDFLPGLVTSREARERPFSWDQTTHIRTPTFADRLDQMDSSQFRFGSVQHDGNRQPVAYQDSCRFEVRDSFLQLGDRFQHAFARLEGIQLANLALEATVNFAQEPMSHSDWVGFMVREWPWTFGIRAGLLIYLRFTGDIEFLAPYEKYPRVLARSGPCNVMEDVDFRIVLADRVLSVAVGRHEKKETELPTITNLALMNEGTVSLQSYLSVGRFRKIRLYEL